MNELVRSIALLPWKAKVTLRDFALISYAVPKQRLLAHLPPPLTLDTRLVDGHETAFVSVGCFKNEGLHWAASPLPRLSFPQLTFRTYVTSPRGPAIFFLATGLGTISSFLTEGVLLRRSLFGKIRIDTDTRAGIPGYVSYGCHARFGSRVVHFRTRAQGVPEAKGPFVDAEEGVLFLTQRLTGYFIAPGGLLMEQRVAHPPMSPWAGQALEEAKIDLLEEMGILRHAELSQPFSVLIEPKIAFEAFPPLPSLAAARLFHRLLPSP